MGEFVLFFRMDILSSEAQPTQEQMAVYMGQWQKWMEGLAAKNKLAEGGNHLSYSGKVIRPGNSISDLPYVVNNESVAGYILVLADDENEAVQIAKECPILNGPGTSVEVRRVDN
jgi:hypothetical protein